MKKYILTPLLFLTACSTLEANVATSIGQPMDNVIQVMGYPTGEEVIRNKKVYLYEDNRNMDNGFHSPCTIRFFVDEKDTVIQTDKIGSLGSCSYTNRLERMNFKG